MHVERTFSVARPAAEVFAALGDFTSTNEWDPGTVTTTRTSGDGGLGTTYANTSQFMGRKVELNYETTTYDSPFRLQFRGVNKSATATDSMSFTATSESVTQIHYRADFEFHGVLKYVAPLLIRRKLDTLADDTVEQIKRFLS